MKLTKLFNKFTKNKIAESLSFLIPVLIGIFLFANPFPHITFIKEITIYLSVALFFVLYLLRPTDYSLKSPLMLAFLLFGLWSFAGLFFALNKENSIHDFFAHLLKYIAYYYLIINFFRTRKHFMVLTWLVIISSVFFSIGNIVYFYGIVGHTLTERLGLFLVQIQTNLIGVVTVFASLLAVSGFFFQTSFRHKIVFFLSFCTSILASIMTQTRSTIIALLVAIIMLLCNKKKILLGLLLILVLILALTPLKDRLTLDTILHNERISTNLVSWEIIKNYPVFGIGFGMKTYDDKKFLMPYYEKVPIAYRHELLIPHPHNLFFDTAVRTGLMGIALFLYVIVNVFRMGWNIWRSGDDPFLRTWGSCLMAAFVAIIIQGMFEPTLSGPPAVILYTIFGMITILWRLCQDEKDMAHPTIE